MFSSQTLSVLSSALTSDLEVLNIMFWGGGFSVLSHHWWYIFELEYTFCACIYSDAYFNVLNQSFFLYLSIVFNNMIAHNTN
ncbi:hypothetical protein DAHU10_041970 [Hanseniaspora uvarum]|nr:hypothetical protein DAHU10_041970 [Hanseniaspora uvarum]